MNVFKSGDPASVKAARKVAEKVFGSNWEQLGSAVYDQGIEKANIWAIGERYHECFDTYLTSVIRPVSQKNTWKGRK